MGHLALLPLRDNEVGAYTRNHRRHRSVIVFARRHPSIVNSGGRAVAIDDLPSPVVNFLNLLGIPWPYVDEDVVEQFAAFTRDFGQAVQTTHQNTTTAIQQLSQAHQGVSTQAMTSGWASLSDTHVSEIVTGCTVLATALDVAAGFIVGQKVAALGTLVAMATTLVGDQILAVMTFGAAEAAVPLILAAGRKVMQALIATLEQYVIGEVIQAAAQPLFDKIQAAMAGLDWSKSGASSTGAGTGFTIDAQAVRTQVAALRSHASTMLSQGQQYQTNVQGLNF